MNPEPRQEHERTPKVRATAAKNGNGSGEAEISPSEELATLFPAARSVTIAGRTVEIKQCGIAQAGRIIDAGMPLYALHVERGAELLSVLEDEPDAVNALIVAATGIDAEWVGSLQPMDKMDLINEWLEVNGDFFFRRLVPRLARFGNAIAGIFGVGRTSSIS